MPVLAFDTHAYVKKLRDAGVPEQQAEVQVEAIAALIEERMATKKDLEDLKRELKALEGELKRELKELDVKLERELKALEVELKRDIAEVRRDIKELEMRLMIRLGGLFFLAVGALAALIKLL